MIFVLASFLDIRTPAEARSPTVSASEAETVGTEHVKTQKKAKTKNPTKLGVPKAYLVSRSLRTAPGIASHRFIAIGRYPGDPEAEIFSFSNEKGKAGRNFDRALVKDCRAWLRLNRNLPRTRRLLRGVNATVIPTTPERIRAYAENLVEDRRYNLFGTNSNTLAQAIANRASGEDVRVYENRLFGALGRRQWHKVTFRDSPETMTLLASIRDRGPSCLAPDENKLSTDSTRAETVLVTAN